jgi:type VI secretion system protein ImpL
MLKHIWKEEAAPDDTVFMACENVRLNVGDAVKFLKEKLATSLAGFRAFHQMPWYLIIGPENTGKTRLLERSQLNFLETDRFVQLTPSRVNTSGNINWWFTQSAALLDVPGNFLEQQEQLTAPRASWLELLKQLKRLRPRRPIHGVVLAIDVQTLSLPIEETAKLLRLRLQEIAFRLKQSFPVYLVCTQTDRLLGFNEYFDDLGKAEREEQLGITFPLHFNQKNSPTQIFSETFDKLLQNLHQRALWRIHHERDQNKRKLIQHFPNQLNTLKENIQRLVYDLSTASYQMAIRGIYFTSTSAEEENTIDIINHQIEKTFSLLPTRHSHPEIPLSSQSQEKSFFIKQLFGDRIFAESAIVCEALRSPTSRRDQLLRFSAMGLATAALLGVTLFWTDQYQHQKTYLTHTSNALSVYRLLSLAYNPHPVDLTTLVPSLNALSLAHNNATEANLPWLLRFQLHHEQSIGTLTSSLYQKELQTKLIPAVRHTLSWQLQSQNITDSTELYSLLQAYLMLGDPTHADKQFLTMWFSRDWQNSAVRNPEFMGHLDAALQNALAPQSPNTGLLTQIRANLNALPYGLLAEAILRTKLSPKPIQPVAFSSQRIFAFPPQGIPEIFTANNLNTVDSQINNSLSEAIQGNWVLGKKVTPTLTVQEISSLKQELMETYAQDYVNTWQNWLNNIGMSSITSSSALELALQELTSVHSPLKQILAAVSKNTNLTGMRSNDPAFIATLQNNLSSHFGGYYLLSNPAKLNAIIEPLKALQTELHTQKPSAKTLSAILSTAKVSPEPLNNWLYSIVVAQRNLGIQTWQLQTYPTCHGLLDNHYPFVKTAQTDATLSSFGYYFAQSGTLSLFFNNTLSPFVNTMQAQWQWKDVTPAFAQGNAGTLSQFERANIIRQLYFNTTNELSVPFTLTLAGHSPNVKNAEILVNNKSTTKTQFTWPKDTENFSVVITDKKGEKHTIKGTGSWALFKLLDKSEVVSHAGNQKFDVNFTVDGYKASYLLSAQPLNPFIPGIVTSFGCPKFQAR